MRQTENSTSPSIGAAVVPLLGLMVFINYADRGNLATAAPLIKDQLHLTATQVGFLLSGFFWTYVPAQLAAGWLVMRFNAYRTLAVGLVIWSIATAASGLAGGFISLMLLRLLLGLGESVAFPGISEILARHVPPNKLGAANGISLIGLGLGPAFGTFAGGHLMAEFGWRNVFLLFGALSLLWLLPWWAATRKLDGKGSQQPDISPPPLSAILRRRELWGTMMGHFCGLYAFYFVILWLPIYLVKERGLSMSHMGEIGGLIYVIYAASTTLSGFAADRLIARGFSNQRVRRVAAVFSLVGSTLSLVVAAFGSLQLSLACLFFTAVTFGVGSSNVYAIPQTLGGPHAAGRWVAIQNSAGNIAGIVAPIITGIVIDRTGQFFWAFIIAGVMCMLGMVGWLLMIPKIAPIEWSHAAAE